MNVHQSAAKHCIVHRGDKVLIQNMFYVEYVCYLSSTRIALEPTVCVVSLLITKNLNIIRAITEMF